MKKYKKAMLQKINTRKMHKLSQQYGIVFTQAVTQGKNICMQKLNTVHQDGLSSGIPVVIDVCSLVAPGPFLSLDCVQLSQFCVVSKLTREDITVKIQEIANTRKEEGCGRRKNKNKNKKESENNVPTAEFKSFSYFFLSYSSSRVKRRSKRRKNHFNAGKR